jgi:predicted glutamine amidotransferase
LYRSCDGAAPSFDAQGLRIGSSTDGGAQALVASVPLTADETWRPLASGELLVLRAGRV